MLSIEHNSDGPGLPRSKKATCLSVCFGQVQLEGS